MERDRSEREEVFEKTEQKRAWRIPALHRHGDDGVLQGDIFFKAQRFLYRALQAEDQQNMRVLGVRDARVAHGATELSVKGLAGGFSAERTKEHRFSGTPRVCHRSPAPCVCWWPPAFPFFFSPAVGTTARMCVFLIPMVEKGGDQGSRSWAVHGVHHPKIVATAIYSHS